MTEERMSTEDYLVKKWFELISLSGGNSRQSEKHLQEILSAYSAPGRYYHNLTHIEWMLQERQQLSEWFRRPLETDFAIFYHDVIYIPGRQDNEERSAALALSRLGSLSIEESIQIRVASMIRATASHRQTGDAETDLFLDLDLAILGSNSNEYRKYRNNIRAEYREASDKEFNSGRQAFLEELLKRPAVFLTKQFQSSRGTQAIENICNELKVPRSPEISVPAKINLTEPPEAEGQENQYLRDQEYQG